MVSMQADINVNHHSAAYWFRNQTTGQGSGKSVSTRITRAEIIQFSFQVTTHTRQDLADQNALFRFNQLDDDLKSSLVYGDRPISDLSADEAAQLVSPDGYFGVEKTARRIIDFVLQGAGDDLERLKQGRDGILRGFREAEKLWGGALPGISHETMEKSLEAVDEKIRQLGGSVVDLTA